LLDTLSIKEEQVFNRIRTYASITPKICLFAGFMQSDVFYQCATCV